MVTASDAYAARFAGAVGGWFLEVQRDVCLELLRDVPDAATALDVGGGHGQIAPTLAEAGLRVTVLGSTPAAFRGAIPGCARHVGDLLALPYRDRSFDVALNLRALPHLDAWDALIAELCRVAARAVIVDYPTLRSVNAVSKPMFRLKRRVEGNTRRFRLFRPADIERAFARHGFTIDRTVPQFALPMALHRALGSGAVSRRLEAIPARLGITRALGSPVVALARRV